VCTLPNYFLPLSTEGIASGTTSHTQKASLLVSTLPKLYLIADRRHHFWCIPDTQKVSLPVSSFRARKASLLARYLVPDLYLVPSLNEKASALNISEISSLRDAIFVNISVTYSFIKFILKLVKV